MALDLLFWDIVGLPEHRRLPLSFRARGSWVLRPLPAHCGVAPDVAEPEALAERVVAWCDARLATGDFASSISAMLEAQAAGGRAGGVTAMDICLHLLNGDDDGALRRCDAPSLDDAANFGGFGTLADDGTMVTFIDRARAWISARQSGACAAA